MASRLAGFFYEQVNPTTLVVDVCELERLCDQVVWILLENNVGRLHVPHEGCVVFVNSLIGCGFLEKRV